MHHAALRGWARSARHGALAALATGGALALLAFGCSNPEREALQTLTSARGDVERLIEAVRAADLSAVEHLYAAGADVNATSRNGESPLSAAITTGNTEMVRLLVTLGAEPWVPLPSGSNALELCVLLDDAAMLEHLLAHSGDRAPLPALLSLADRLEHAATAEVLLPELPVPSAEDLFALGEQLELVGYPFDGTARFDNASFRAAIVAYQRTHGLGSHGYPTPELRTHLARMARGYEAGAFAAAFTGNLDSLKRFIASGVSHDAVDAAGRTLLMNAVLGEQPEIVQYLCDDPLTDLNVHDPSDMTAYAMARARNLDEIAKIFERAVVYRSSTLDLSFRGVELPDLRRRPLTDHYALVFSRYGPSVEPLRQSVKISETFPTSFIASAWEQGFAVWRAEWVGHRWVVVAAKNTGYTDQTFFSGYDLPSAEINEGWKMGKIVSSASFDGTRWWVVMSRVGKTSGIASDGEIVRAHRDGGYRAAQGGFPVGEIEAVWKQDKAFVSRVEHGADSWIVFKWDDSLSRNLTPDDTGFMSQIETHSESFPADVIDRRSRQGWDVTSIEYDGHEWGVIFTMGTGIREQLWVHATTLPVEEIERLTAEGWELTTAAYRPTEPESASDPVHAPGRGT